MSTAPTSKEYKTFLDVVNARDNFPILQWGLQVYIDSIDRFYHLVIPPADQTVRLVIPSVVSAFRGLQGWKLDEPSRPRTLALVDGTNAASRAVIVEKTLHKFCDEKILAILSRWRNELKHIYGSSGELPFKVDRAAAPLLRLVSYGIHRTAFTRSDDGHIKLWVQKRSQSTAFYPGHLDNTKWRSLKGEQATLPEDLVRSRTKSCGTVTYMHLHNALAIGEVGLVQPQVEDLFELELPGGAEPKPCDHKVEWFKLFDAEELIESILQGNHRLLSKLRSYVNHLDIQVTSYRATLWLL
ncbi:hypothetical protein QC763_608340 [Podospora pseudopauciseta]|uniref:Nudix hydrolase domain-containing protein n=1 Tax=Podospora pseudopauciseta TaxID=2093780 RepID=A0ABR0H5W9_9PEZI|nr:hypothetical protein QC763_608340 [Podospora pseudopauciseta]